MEHQQPIRQQHARARVRDWRPYTRVSRSMMRHLIECQLHSGRCLSAWHHQGAGKVEFRQDQFRSVFRQRFVRPTADYNFPANSSSWMSGAHHVLHLDDTGKGRNARARLATVLQQNDGFVAIHRTLKNGSWQSFWTPTDCECRRAEAGVTVSPPVVLIIDNEASWNPLLELHRSREQVRTAK